MIQNKSIWMQMKLKIDLLSTLLFLPTKYPYSTLMEYPQIRNKRGSPLCSAVLTQHVYSCVT
jgi:hypothetical protein